MTPQTTVAFYGKSELKQMFMDRIEGHRKADELIHGTGWEDGKGCAIGCLFHKYDHVYGEKDSGVPRTILRLIDGLFESLPKEIAKEWPERSFSAIRPGADLSLVMAKWFILMLVDPQDGVIKFAKTDIARNAIQEVANLYTSQDRGEAVSVSDFKKYADAAPAATSAYAYAAADAAAAASSADAAAASAYAYAYAYAAASAASAYAASAAASTYAYAHASAANATRKQYRIKQANKLIELLSAA